MNLNEELKKIDDFLNDLSPESLSEILDRNGYGTVGVPLEARIETKYDNNTSAAHYSLDSLLDSVVVGNNNSNTIDSFPEAA
jgi:hypothetical protein